jgi:hypothetical protein
LSIFSFDVSLMAKTRREREFWACWCSGNATGHITGHVAGSKACRLLP